MPNSSVQRLGAIGALAACPHSHGTFVETTARWGGGRDEVHTPDLSGGVIGEFERLSEDEQNAIVGEYLEISESPGVIGGDQLQPVETATTVRIQNGQTLLTDGPFVEAKEHLGGYLLVEADDLDTALEIAARIPAARMGGAIEVRPLVER
jgi:hypothetical protein